MKIIIIKQIRCTIPVKALCFVPIMPGPYDVEDINKNGAISVLSSDGKKVGVKLDEFEFTSEKDRAEWVAIAYPNIPRVHRVAQ